MLFNSDRRLKAIVKFNRRKFEVSFGSKDTGVSLQFEAVPLDEDTPIRRCSY